MRYMSFPRVSLAGAVFLLALFTYLIGLTNYLSGLSYPVPVYTLFCYFLILVYFTQLRRKQYKTAFAWGNLIATTVIWAISIPTAETTVILYKMKLTQLLGDKEFLEKMQIGVDYVSVVHNPAFGLGTCFFISMMPLKLIFHGFLKKRLTRLITGKAEVEQPCYCLQCGQAIVRTKKTQPFLRTILRLPSRQNYTQNET